MSSDSDSDLIISSPSDTILFFIEKGDNIVFFNKRQDRDKYLCEIAKKHPYYITCSLNDNIYTKLFPMYDEWLLTGLSNTINIYKDIENLDITPRLIEVYELVKYRIGEYYDDNKYYDADDRVGIVYMIITEKYGISLADKYSIAQQGPGCDLSTFTKYYDFYFPPNKIPDHIRSQIKPLLQKLFKAGWKHEDIHAGNFLVQDDIVKIIDFECASRRASLNLHI